MTVSEIPLSLIPSTNVSIDGSAAVRGLSTQTHRVLMFGAMLAGVAEVKEGTVVPTDGDTVGLAIDDLDDITVTSTADGTATALLLMAALNGAPAFAAGFVASVNADAIIVSKKTAGTFTMASVSPADADITPITTTTTGIAAGGTATPLEAVSVTREDQGDALFGYGTPLAEMCRAFRRHNRRIELTVIPQAEDDAGSAATGSFSVVGTATANGALYMYIGGRRIVAAVTEGDTSAEITTAAIAAITADARCYASALVDGGDTSKANLTAKWAGATGNDLSVFFNYYGEDEAFPPGVTATATAFSGGATDPDVSAAIAVMGDSQYHSVVVPWRDTANLNALKTTMEARWGPTAKNEGLTIIGYRGDYAATQGFGNGRNSKTEVVIGSGPAPSPPWMWAATFSAIESAITDPAEPRFGRRLPELLPPLASARFVETERELLLADGVSTYAVTPAGDVVSESILTTYQVNDLNVPDRSFRWIETLRTASYYRQDMLVFLGLRFALHKVADDGTPVGPGQKVATPSLVRGAVIGRYAQYMQAAICEDGAAFSDSLVVLRHPDDEGRIDILSYPDFVNQLRNMAARASFLL